MGNTWQGNELWVGVSGVNNGSWGGIREGWHYWCVQNMTLGCLPPRPMYEQRCPAVCSTGGMIGPSLASHYSSAQSVFITGWQEFLLRQVYETSLPTTAITRNLINLISSPVLFHSGFKPNLSKCRSTLRLSLWVKIWPHVYASLSRLPILDLCMYLNLAIWDVAGSEMLHTSNECLIGALVNKKNKYCCK